MQCIETHGAFVFLIGSHVYKIKRSVKHAYMDFSTLNPALSLLPLFLGLSASVRSMVSFQRSQVQAGAAQQESSSLGASYLSDAVSCLTPVQGCLVAIGGLSGTGKSTQARALSPKVGPSPGAIHIRSDQERKLLAKVCETQRIQPAAYTEASSRQVYTVIIGKAELALRAGHSVVLDKTQAELLRSL